MWSSLIVRVKSILGNKPDLPKEPRKKIELQLRTIQKQFQEQVAKLEEAVDNPELPPSIVKTGKHLLSSSQRFHEFQFAQITKIRLQNLPNSLIDQTDFSLWVRQEMINQTELIYHFLSTVGDY